MTFDEVWNLLYTSTRHVYDVEICMKWLSDAKDDKKNDKPIELDFCLSGQGWSPRKCDLGLFLNLPGSVGSMPVSYRSVLFV